MQKCIFLRAAVAAAVLTLSAQAWAERLITDQIGREVKIPDTVNRVVVLQHQTLNLLVQLNASDKIVGVLSTWRKNLGPRFVRFDPKLKDMPTPGDLTSVNIEGVLALKPDVVFIANYAPKEMIDSLERAGLPAVAVSLRRDAAGEAAKLNPTMTDEDKAYSLGLQDGIRPIADVVAANNILRRGQRLRACGELQCTAAAQVNRPSRKSRAAQQQEPIRRDPQAPQNA